MAHGQSIRVGLVISVLQHGDGDDGDARSECCVLVRASVWMDFNFEHDTRPFNVHVFVKCFFLVLPHKHTRAHTPQHKNIVYDLYYVQI